VFGISPPMSLAELQDVQHGEMMRGYAVFSKDVYGLRDPLYSERISRGRRSEIAKAMGDDLEGEAKRLLEWTGGTNGNYISPEKLPDEKR
jgi:hypothetical protein